MHSSGGVRLKLKEEPRTVVIPPSPRPASLKAITVQKHRRPAIEASELVLAAITLLLMGLLFAVAHHIVQHPWVVVRAPIPTTMISQSIVLNPAEGASASGNVR